MKFKLQTVLSATLMVALLSMTGAAEAADAKAIMSKVFGKKSPKSTKAEMTMVLISSSGSEQKRQMKMEQLGEDDSLMWFVSPNDLRGTALLSVGNGDDEKMWLYLPAFKNKQRISGSKKKDSFMGSDFTYEDMSKREVEDYTYKYVKGIKRDGKKYHVIESIPVDKDSGYTKIINYVELEHMEITSAEMYGPTGELVKKSEVKKVETIKGYRIPSLNIMTDVTRDHSTRIELNNIELDVDVPASHFKESYLSRVR